MLRITDTKRQKVESKVTLNDVPVGQVFRGTLTGKNSGQRKTGIFYKHCGQLTIGSLRDVVVLNLSNPGLDSSGYANLYLDCIPIENYEPVEAELILR
jgi:hypothetical protein